jgi:hypothetical protein
MLALPAPLHSKRQNVRDTFKGAAWLDTVNRGRSSTSCAQAARHEARRHRSSRGLSLCVVARDTAIAPSAAGKRAGRRVPHADGSRATGATSLGGVRVWGSASDPADARAPRAGASRRKRTLQDDACVAQARPIPDRTLTREDLSRAVTCVTCTQARTYKLQVQGLARGSACVTGALRTIYSAPCGRRGGALQHDRPRRRGTSTPVRYSHAPGCCTSQAVKAAEPEAAFVVGDRGCQE